MRHSAALRGFVRERVPRVLLASVGLIIVSFGIYLQLQSDIGLSPWGVLSQGMALQLSMTYGNATILVSLSILAIDLLLREPIGIGTILDALLSGWAIDFFLWLDPIPLQTSPLPQIFLMLASLVAIALGEYLYMRAALSCGPRDAMLVALGRCAPRVPIGVINTLIFAAALITGFLLGGQVGLGTIICLFGTGAVMDLVFKLVRFEPRRVAHEGLTQTIAALFAACKADATHTVDPAA